MALTSNFLSRPNLRSVAHNSVSRLFLTDPGFVDWLGFMTQYSMPAAAAFAEATDKWGSTVEKDQTAFNVAAQTNVPFFEYFAKTSDLSNQFASYMRSVQASSGTSLHHLLTGYDWESLDEGAVVVDVSATAIHHENHRQICEIRGLEANGVGQTPTLRSAAPPAAPPSPSRPHSPSSDSASKTSRTPSPTAPPFSPRSPPPSAPASPRKPTTSSPRSPSGPHPSTSSA